ncbi:MAG TPA: hypothetical protein VFS37_14185 [Conexibacter sp.]|nr:hypothetical protein [Conexibacter sp.]
MLCSVQLVPSQLAASVPGGSLPNPVYEPAAVQVVAAVHVMPRRSAKFENAGSGGVSDVHVVPFQRLAYGPDLPPPAEYWPVAVQSVEVVHDTE